MLLLRGDILFVSLGVVGILLLLLLVAYFVGIVLEFEYPHILTLRRVRRARALNGSPALPLIAAELGVHPGDIHLHICTYCLNVLETRIVIHVQFVDAQGRTHHFAYNTRTAELAPASDLSVARFASMAPGGGELEMVRSGVSYGDDGLMLPKAWAAMGGRWKDGGAERRRSR